MSMFKKAEETKSGLKVLAYGSTGSGKTTFALSFPNITAIDSEDGMAWYKNNPNLKYILNTTSVQDVEDALEELEEESENIGTFVLDSETKVYENMQLSGLNVAERRARNKGQSVDDANISQREWGKIKLVTKRIQSTKIMLSSKGINVISIAQEKDIKEKKGDSWVIVGHAPDTSKGLEYDYDIVLRLFTEKDKDGDIVYKAEILKDRTGSTKRGQIIENPSFENWRAVYEGSMGKKEDVKNFKGDIDKDTKKMSSELEQMDELIARFKVLMKELKDDSSKQTLVKKKLVELGIDNPLATDKGDELEQVIKFMEDLSK